MKMNEEKQEDKEKTTKPQDEKFSEFELSILQHDIFIKGNFFFNVCKTVKRAPPPNQGRKFSNLYAYL